MRTNWTSGTLLILAASLAAGCAASGPAFQRVAIPDGKSVIYAYRPNSIFGGGVVPTVTCGASAVSLSRGGYHPFIIDPGTVTCHAATESTSTVRVDTRPNEASYVKEEIGMGFFIGRPHLQVTSKETGESEVLECKLQQE